MRMLEVLPDARLAPYVRRFTIVESDEEATRTLIPDRGLILGLRYRGAATQLDDGTNAPLPDAVLTGLRDRPRLMRTAAGSGIVLATFREDGASAFFREPLHELFDTRVALDALAGAAEVDRALSRIAAAPDLRERIGVMESFLLARLRPQGVDPAVAAAVEALRDAHGAIRVADLAEELGLSPDRLEKRFRHAVGASPKKLASLLRLRRALELHGRGESLTRLSLDAGYFDQSHFIRDFRRFTGAAPRAVLGAEEYC